MPDFWNIQISPNKQASAVDLNRHLDETRFQIVGEHLHASNLTPRMFDDARHPILHCMCNDTREAPPANRARSNERIQIARVIKAAQNGYDVAYLPKVAKWCVDPECCYTHHIIWEDE